MSSFTVSYNAGNWFKAALQNHSEVLLVEIEDHHFFRIRRRKVPQQVNAVLIDIYTFGLADVLKARQEFPDATCLVTNGDWNGYTPEAKDYGLENAFGIFNTTEFLGALRWDEIYQYHKTDGRGRPVYQTRAA
jgi:hypothetical protein